MLGLTPYRVIVFCKGNSLLVKAKPRKNAKPQPTGYAFQAWNPVTTAEPERAGYGTFLFPGLHAARTTAIMYLAEPETEQVSVRTNQDQEIYHFWKPSAAQQLPLFVGQA